MFFFTQLKVEPKRDRIGRELAEKVAKQHRDKKAQAVERIKRLNTYVLINRSDRISKAGYMVLWLEFQCKRH